MTTKKKIINKKAKVKKKLIIAHGWEGSPEKGWFPWLKEEAEKAGWEVHAPALPNAEEPKVHEWLQALTQAAGKVNENTYMIGYGLGCVTILKFLETLSNDNSIGGSVFIAGFDNPINIQELENFFHNPINWEKVKRVCKKFVVINSEDDPYVPADNCIRLKNNLDAKKILLNGFRHFSGDDGMTSLPVVLQELLELSDSAK